MTKALAPLALVATFGLVAGCGPSTANQLPTHPVSGKVTMGGAPVPGATVTFAPLDDSKPAAMGVTDPQGVYSLRTYSPGDGAVAGEYKILVNKSSGGSSSGPGEMSHDPTGEGGGPTAPQQHGGPSGGGGGGGSLLPEKYANIDTTTLMKSVSEGENTIDLELN